MLFFSCLFQSLLLFFEIVLGFKFCHFEINLRKFAVFWLIWHRVIQSLHLDGSYTLCNHADFLGSRPWKVDDSSSSVRTTIYYFHDYAFIISEIGYFQHGAEWIVTVCTRQTVVMYLLPACRACACGSLWIIRCLSVLMLLCTTWTHKKRSQ